MASSLNGRFTPMLPFAFARPTGVVALASSNSHWRVLPCSLKRTSDSTVPAGGAPLAPGVVAVSVAALVAGLVPAGASGIIVSFASCASRIASSNGGARLAGILAGPPSRSVCMVRLATRSWLMATPFDRYWNGDQEMSILSPVINWSGLRNTTWPRCIEPYSEPLTPVMTILPPLDEAIFCASVCSVDSRPRYQ